MSTPPPSPDLISINSCERLNFGDLHSIFYDCGVKIVEQQIKVDYINEEIGRNLEISRVDSLTMQRRLTHTKKNVHTLTVLVVRLMVMMFGFLVDKVHSLINN
ncbi:unnamed protein product [Lactuca saligna]|uniref:Uncharacterized protein n=1 Tax=Lactuca saligna TaxID=75948 RepID=A0AA35YH03_LACSI|nr:unnamed protein product [Lactuca saligna]